MYKQDKRKTLFKLIENSIGTKLFRNNYFFINGKSKDLLRNGELSCAFYVSSILYLLKLIKDVHTTSKLSRKKNFSFYYHEELEK